MLENLKRSLDGWRTILNMPNGLVHLINLTCIGAGTHLTINYQTPISIIGLTLIAVGLIGLLEAAYGRVIA